MSNELLADKGLNMNLYHVYVTKGISSFPYY